MNFNQNCSAKWPIKQRSAVAKCPFQGNDLAWSWSWKYIDQRYPENHCQFSIVSTYRMFMNNIDFWKNGTFWLMFVCLLVLELGSNISHGDAHSSLIPDDRNHICRVPWGHELPLCYWTAFNFYTHIFLLVWYLWNLVGCGALNFELFIQSSRRFLQS